MITKKLIMGNIDEAIERDINGESDDYDEYGNKNVFGDWWVCNICGWQNTHNDIICHICEDGNITPEEFAKRNNIVISKM